MSEIPDDIQDAMNDAEAEADEEDVAEEAQAYLADPIKAALDQLAALDPDQFFGKNGLEVEHAAVAIRDAIHYGWNSSTDSFLVYVGGRWLEGKRTLRKAVLALLGDRYRGKAAADMLAALELMPGIQMVNSDPVEPNRWLNFDNLLLEWPTDKVYPHAPEYCGVTQLPVRWVPGAKCPTFEKFLTEVLPKDCWEPSPECPEGFIWEVLGYAIFFGNPLQIAFMLSGDGGNGKGRFLHVLWALIGLRNISSVKLHELTENRFRPATLYGKLANLAGDLDPRWLENTATFKSLTGGDVFQGEKKFGHPFDFTPWATPFYSVNKPFGSSDNSNGYWRRWIVISFPYDHTKSNRTDDEIDRENTTPTELSGILNRAVPALRTLMKRGRFAEPKSVVAAKNEFREFGDRVRGWAKECALLSPRIPFIDRKLLLSSFRNFTEEDKGRPMRTTEFYARLRQLDGVQPKTVNGTRGFSGISIR